MFDCDFRDDTSDGIYCKKLCNIVNSVFCDSCPLEEDNYNNEYIDDKELKI